MFTGSVELEGNVRLASASLYKVNNYAAGIVAVRESPSSWNIVMRKHTALNFYFEMIHIRLKDERLHLHNCTSSQRLCIFAHGAAASIPRSLHFHFDA